MSYRIKIEIIDKDEELVVGGGTEFDYESIGTFGDCEKVDEEVGKVMRRLVHKVEVKEGVEELMAELINNN